MLRVGADSGTSWRGLLIALSIAAVLVVLAFAMRIALDAPAGVPLPQRLMPLLFAAAAWCAAALTLRHVPSLAWLASVAAAGIAAEEIVAVARAAQPLAGAGSWPVLVVLSAAALVCASGVAVAYAARRRPPGGTKRVARIVAGVLTAAFVASAGTGLWAIVTAASEAPATSIGVDLWPIRLAARVSLGLIAIGLLVGVVRDLAGPVGRVRVRRQAQRSHPPATTPAGSGGAASSFLSELADELWPARSGDRRQAEQHERARLAADIHAFVLPELRQATAAAESSGVPEEVAAGLRRSLEEIEQLMHQRQSVVLEEFGLVAALEWLAERTEERSALRVNLELDGNLIDDPRAVSADVSRLAFRIALLALDNVVRHARATTVAVSLSVTSGAVALAIADDGISFDPATIESGGRGLVDMRAEAAAAGGVLDISRLNRGTRVELAWPAPDITGYHASPDRNLPARPETQAG